MASSEEVVRQSITFRYNSVKSKVALMEARLKDVNNLVKVKNPSLLLQLQKNTPQPTQSKRFKWLNNSSLYRKTDFW